MYKPVGFGLENPNVGERNNPVEHVDNNRDFCLTWFLHTPTTGEILEEEGRRIPPGRRGGKVSRKDLTVVFLQTYQFFLNSSINPGEVIMGPRKPPR